MRPSALDNHKSVITERNFQSQIITLARYYRWKVAHFRPGLTKRGRWVTAVQADGAGFPDLVLARQGRIIFVELKSERGQLSERQQAWRQEILPAEFYLWRPSDYDRVAEILK